MRRLSSASWTSRATASLAALLPVVSLLAAFLAPAADAVEPSREVVAVVGGEPIYRDQVEARVAMEVFKLRAGIHQILQREIESMVEERLLAAEAARRGVSVDELLEREVTSQVEEVDEAEVEAYLREHPAERAGPVEARERVRTFLGESRRLERRMAFLAELRERAGYELRLPEPEPPRTAIDVTGAPQRGAPEAKVTVVSFASFHCPRCTETAAFLDQLDAELPGQLRRVHLNTIPSVDEVALEAALLALAAQEQGVFWEVHDRLMARGAELDSDAVAAIADELGLEVDRGRLLPRLRDEIVASRKVGAQHAPVVFVNGRYWSGTFPLSRLRDLVLEELQAAGSGTQRSIDNTAIDNPAKENRRREPEPGSSTQR